MHVWNVLHAARWNTGCKHYAKNRHLGTIPRLCPAISSQLSMYRQSEKNLLSSNISSTCPSQYGELRPTNGWDLLGSLGHPYKFRRVLRLGFVTAPTSLNGGQPNFAQCFAISWTGILYIHFWAFLPLTEFCQLQNTLCVQVLHFLYWQYCCMAFEQWASAKVCGVWQGMELQNFRRGRHLYLAGRPSHLALALVLTL